MKSRLIVIKLPKAIKCLCSSGNSIGEAGTTTNTATFATNAVTKSSDIYIYGVGIAAVLAIGACAVFAYKKKYSLTLNNKRVKGPVGHMETYKTTKKMKHALDMMVKKLYINK